MRLAWDDPRTDPAAWARRLGVPREAVDLYLASDVVDPHTDSYVWARLGYDLTKRHRSPIPGTPFLNQVDFPRAREGALTGVVWDIATFPFRTARGRLAAGIANVRALEALIGRYPEDLAFVRSASDYRVAKAAGKLACWIALQGGNAFDESPDALDRIPDDAVSRITLVHWTRSRIGHSSADTKGTDRKGLTPFGRSFVQRMVEKRILVDLAHVHRDGFADALEEVPAGVPVIASHTGVAALRPIFRNLDDGQLRAIAERGGTIGIMYQSYFLGPTRYRYRLSLVVDHMEHVVRTVGEDHLSLGSDYDGSVILPLDMRDVTEQPKLVAEMLQRGWSPERVAKVLGGNYLRVLASVRP